jgi:hypothetical protein
VIDICPTTTAFENVSWKIFDFVLLYDMLL